ncbi:hypothetical protein GCM10012285_24190 [Streptomyces kronopolitis]|uniref:Secreted protein n=1 Tax=Streptomyces kronopolitis TaxID=1612435 RepID=A0ABQ2JCQ2_9ACTN|nr:hypothetical protein GCM10012285_24190 [Streptomyces kronopolitis]
MISRKVRSVAVGACLAVAASGLSFLFAAPANADQADCITYLKRHGYTKAWAGVRHACSRDGAWADENWCWIELTSLRVDGGVAGEACRRARW